ncbi:MAG: hypothetical protein LBP38_05385 [Desulfovibrio sp.]|jgi:hypothetical protein|nr:hypothetical protein [Desulfovibrio sp.]
MKKVFLILSLLLCGIRPAAGADGPLSAAETAQKGIDACDSDLFSKGVDMDRVALRAVQDILKEDVLSGQAEKKAGGAAGLLASLGAASPEQAALIARLLASELRGFAVSGINSCLFAGKEGAQSPRSGGMLAAALDRLPSGRREIRAGKILRLDKGKARISAEFVDPRAGAFPLVLGVERQNGAWRIVEIDNVPELLEQAAGHGH